MPKLSLTTIKDDAIRVKAYLQAGGNMEKASKNLGISRNDLQSTIDTNCGKILLSIFNDILSKEDVLTIEERKRYFSNLAKKFYEVAISDELNSEKANTAMKAIDCLNKMEGVGNEVSGKEAAWIERVKESVDISRKIAQSNRLLRLMPNFTPITIEEEQNAEVVNGN
jgi:hypothetical protein